MHLEPVVRIKDVEEAHRLFKISTLNAAQSGMSNSKPMEAPGEL